MSTMQPTWPIKDWSVRCDPQRIKEAERVIEEGVQSGEFPSMVAAAANREGIFWQYVVPGDDGVRWDTIFQVASITKTAIAAGVMQLVERGRLLLSDSVKEYVPEFGQNGKHNVTVWNLLTHTSGIDEADLIVSLYSQRAPLAEYLKVACTLKLTFKPGTQSKTANLGYVVLAELLSRVSGKPYDRYLAEHIFAQLDMPDTSFSPQPAERVPPVYGLGEPDIVEYFNSLASPFGGLWSTVGDLITYGRAFLNNGRLDGRRILSEASVETMTRLHTGGLVQMNAGEVVPVYYAFGWGLRSPKGVLLGSERSYGQAGATGAWIWIDPLWDLVYVQLSNRWGREINHGMRVTNAVYGALERVPATVVMK